MFPHSSVHATDYEFVEILNKFYMDLNVNIANFPKFGLKLSKNDRRISQKQLKLRNTLLRHENLQCSDVPTKVCLYKVVRPLFSSKI